jgi:hypothetical protein
MPPPRVVPGLAPEPGWIVAVRMVARPSTVPTRVVTLPPVAGVHSPRPATRWPRRSGTTQGQVATGVTGGPVVTGSVARWPSARTRWPRRSPGARGCCVPSAIARWPPVGRRGEHVGGSWPPGRSPVIVVATGRGHHRHGRTHHAVGAASGDLRPPIRVWPLGQSAPRGAPAPVADLAAPPERATKRPGQTHAVVRMKIPAAVSASDGVEIGNRPDGCGVRLSGPGAPRSCSDPTSVPITGNGHPGHRSDRWPPVPAAPPSRGSGLAT